MTNEDFAQLALSKVRSGSFKPLVNYCPDEDSLEVLVSDETYREESYRDNRIQKCGFLTVFYGRDSGNVVGIRIDRVGGLIEDIEKDPPDIRFEIHNGRFKVAHLFRAIREKSKKNSMTLAVLIRPLEKAAEDFNLEANTCAAV
jgi:hypothetical protein